MLQLPPELLYLVADFLGFPDVNSFIQVSHWVNEVLNSILYKRAVLSMYESSQKSVVEGSWGSSTWGVRPI